MYWTISFIIRKYCIKNRITLYILGRNRDKNFRSMRRRARIREMDTSDLYRYDPYETSYSSTVQGKKLNRRISKKY